MKGSNSDVGDLTSQDNVTATDAGHKSMKHKRPSDVKERNNKKTRKNEVSTAGELNNLGEMETLYHSSLFHMQNEELLKEVKVKLKWKNQMGDWLERLKKFLFEIPESKKFDLTEQGWTKKLKVPIIQDPFSVKGIFQFLPPADIKVVGSYPLNLACLPHATVDVAIEMPKDCWQHGDFLNLRYHRKRALYLVYIASYLKKAAFIEELYFSYQHGNHLRPVLLLSPAGKLGKQMKVCLLPYPPKGYFKISRFSPLKNNVRASWFFKEKQMESENEHPTPHINGSVLIDITMVQNADFLQEVLCDIPNIEEGILLLKIWFKQRGLSQGYGGFSNFIVTMLVVYLLKTSKINPLVSSFQVFRSTLLAICQEAVLEKGVAFGNKTELKEFHEAFQVVFVDKSGSLNICSWLTEKTLQRVQHEARISLEYMDSDFSNCFGNLFLKPVSFCQKFDHVMHIADCGCYARAIDVLKLHSSLLDHGGNTAATVLLALENLITKALHDRIYILGRIFWNPGKWKITDCPPDPNNIEKISFGLLLNPEKYSKTVDRGPPADTPEAEQFREFWGEKSELRRFLDGGICEAVVWPKKCFSERQKIISNILRHILKIHASIPEENIEYYCDQLNVVLSLPNAHFPEEWPSYGIGEDATLEAVSKFNELTKELRKLKNMPLSVASVQGISPVLRYTEVFPPLPLLYKPSKKITETRGNSLILKQTARLAPQWVHPIEVLLTMERSGKWPDEVEAIHWMKTAFYFKLSEELYSQFSLTSAVHESYLDVLKEGFIFRISIASHKELLKLKQNITADGILKTHDTKESLILERKIVHLPNLSSNVYGLHHQNNAYSSGCRLAKRWISSQMLSDYISEPCVELLMAYTFLSPSPFTIPNCQQAAFLRFLFLLSNYDWKTSPLIVNFNNKLQKEECTEICSNFTKKRTTLPVMVIVTPFDKDGTTWTKKIDQVIFSHLVNISKEAYKSLEGQILKEEKSDFKKIFRPPIDIYDVTIFLKPCQVPRRYQAVDTLSVYRQPVHSTYRHNKDEKIPIVGYNPVEYYLKELRELFDDIAFFFYDHFGGDAIYVLWKPKVFEARDSRASHIKYQMMESNGKFLPDIEAIIGEFAVIGTGLVKEIV